MNLGLDVRGGIEKLPTVLEAILARINTVWKKEHNIDGTHGSMTVSGDLVVDGDVIVGGDISGGGTPIVPPHAPTHNTGGTDPITALSGGVITTGTVADARLSSNVALEDVANTFSQRNTITTPLTQLEVAGTGGFSSIVFNSVSEPVNLRKWRVSNFTQRLVFEGINDAESAVTTPSVIFDRAGGIVERTRAVAMGEWQDVPFNSANFTAVGGGTWTVGSAAVIRNRYTLIGKTMIWELYISWFSGGNTLAGTVTSVNIACPGGFTINSNALFRRHFSVAGGTVVDADISTSATVIGIARTDGVAWTGSPAVGLVTTLTFSLA